MFHLILGIISLAFIVIAPIVVGAFIAIAIVDKATKTIDKRRQEDIAMKWSAEFYAYPDKSYVVRTSNRTSNRVS